jgi:cytochrome P450
MTGPSRAVFRLEGLRKLEFLRRMAGNAQEAFRWMHTTYGKTVSMHIRGGEYVSTIELRNVRHVLKDNHQNYSKGTQYIEFEPLWGKENLLASHGEVWTRHRRVVAAEFHPGHLSHYQPLIIHHTRALLDSYAQGSRTGESFPLYEGMRTLIMRILCDKWFGALSEPDVQRMGLLLTELTDIAGARAFVPIKLPLWLPTPTHVRYRRLLDELQGLLARVLQEHEAEARDRMNLLGQMLAAQDAEPRRAMTRQELLDNLVVLLLAAYETPTLGWTLYFIGKSPHAAGHIQAEVQQVLGSRAPEMEDLPRLKYVRMCVDEGMRMFTVSPLLVRQALAHDELGACPIEAGTHVVVPTCVLHRDPELWPRPHEFQPERFADPAGIPPFSFMPFGKGARECIGSALARQFSTAIVAMLFQRYTYTLEPDYEARPNNKFTPYPLGNVPAYLQPRAA